MNMKIKFVLAISSHLCCLPSATPARTQCDVCSSVKYILIYFTRILNGAYFFSSPDRLDSMDRWSHEAKDE